MNCDDLEIRIVFVSARFLCQCFRRRIVTIRGRCCIQVILRLKFLLEHSCFVVLYDRMFRGRRRIRIFILLRQLLIFPEPVAQQSESRG